MVRCGAGTVTTLSVTTGTETTSLTKGVAVDPYIVGATFCEDINNNGSCEDGEQVSTASDGNGEFSFQNNLTIGSTILIKDKGKHNGIAYTGAIKRIVEQSDKLVVSPLTTILANGWTEQQIIEVLTTAGLTGITAADLKNDPMAGIENLNSTKMIEDDLGKIRASISVYSFLSIIDGVIKQYNYCSAVSGYNLPYDCFIQHPEWKTLLTQMVTQIKDGISKDVLIQIDNTLATATTQCTGAGLSSPPSATVGDIIRASVAISDYIIPKVIESCGVLDQNTGYPKCDYAPTSTEYYNWRWELGENFYVLRNKDNTCISTGIIYGLLPSVSSCTTFQINNTTGTVECIK